MRRLRHDHRRHGQRFCPACGQATPARRIDWRFLRHEFEQGVLQMERGLLYTLRNLLLRPGHFIREYVEGRRAGHVKPLLLVTMAAAVVAFLSHYLPDGETMKAVFARDVADATLVDAMKQANDWMDRHLALVTFLLLPVEALAFRLAFRRARNLNYPEWLVIVAYMTAQSLFFWAFSILFQRWIPGATIWMLWLAMGYGVLTLVQFFAGWPRWNVALRTLLAYGLYLAANIVLGGALAVALLALHRA